MFEFLQKLPGVSFFYTPKEEKHTLLHEHDSKNTAPNSKTPTKTNYGTTNQVR